MNRNNNVSHRADDPALDEVDRLLAAHIAPGEKLRPSSGFLANVMEAVQSDATAPPPLPFPWRRALPGLIAVICALIGFGIFALQELTAISAAGVVPRRTFTLALASGQFHLTTVEQALCWISASVCLAMAAVGCSMWLARSGITMKI